MKRLVAMMAVLVAMHWNDAPAFAQASNRDGKTVVPFRMAMSTRMLTDVNENDAKAAVRAWSEILADQSGVSVDPAPLILAGRAAFKQAFERGEADGATLPIDEFLALPREAVDSNLVSQTQPRLGIEYLLLVAKEKGPRQLSDLKGHELLVLDNLPSMCLAIPWLDVVLARQGEDRAEQFFSRLNFKKKLPMAVLPVFFGSSQACLVTRSGLEVMVELNPQVGTKLRILAASPSYVTGVCCFRKNYDSPDKERILGTMLHFQQSSRGQQILALFQSGALGLIKDSDLDSARQLIADHERLCGLKSGQPIAARSGEDKGPPPK